ncbi:hypothetical protein POM88_009583 [Heracleum sosnowskyi]|uniref:Uncharacterized protein n=1 Tax=Heracleum sosnowskyi TaxID=360622 RepID=A0AAD8N2S7_9APIA|nr:hypothetical protein POM88_009583 [Heracleum sosnowskyi]
MDKVPEEIEAPEAFVQEEAANPEAVNQDRRNTDDIEMDFDREAPTSKANDVVEEAAAHSDSRIFDLEENVRAADQATTELVETIASHTEIISLDFEKGEEVDQIRIDHPTEAVAVPADATENVPVAAEFVSNSEDALVLEALQQSVVEIVQREAEVRTSELIEVSENEFVTPTGFYFLYESQLLLTFRDRTVAVWNSGGDLVTSYEDHLIWHPDSKSNIICLTNQNLIISYCKVHSNDRQEAQKAGSVNISNILTGKCLAKINAGNTHLLKECECSGRRCNASKAIRATEITSTVQEALENVTALFYDEDRNELYTGSKNGLLHVWSN